MCESGCFEILYWNRKGFVNLVSMNYVKTLSYMPTRLHGIDHTYTRIVEYACAPMGLMFSWKIKTLLPMVSCSVFNHVKASFSFIYQIIFKLTLPQYLWKFQGGSNSCEKLYYKFVIFWGIEIYNSMRVWHYNVCKFWLIYIAVCCWKQRTL